MNFLDFTSMDLVCLLVCGVLGLSGYRRGAINSLISFGGFIASFVIARLFSPLLAGKMAQSLLFRSLFDKIKIEEISRNLLEASLNGNEFPAQIYKMGENYLMNQSGEALKEAILLGIAQFISFGLIIILVSIFFWVLRFFFKGIRRVPVIGAIDRALGLGIGLIIGLGFCFLIIWIFKIIDLYNNEALNFLNYQNSVFYEKIVGLLLKGTGN